MVSLAHKGSNPRKKSYFNKHVPSLVKLEFFSVFFFFFVVFLCFIQFTRQDDVPQVAQVSESITRTSCHNRQTSFDSGILRRIPGSYEVCRMIGRAARRGGRVHCRSSFVVQFSLESVHVLSSPIQRGDPIY